MEPNIDLNNTIVHFRKVVGEAKSCVKAKLKRQIGKLRKLREKLELESKKCEKTMQRYLEEKRALKDIDPDEVSKFAMLNRKTLHELKNMSKLPSDRIIFKLATNESMTSAIEEFRKEYPKLRQKDLRRLCKESKIISAIGQETGKETQDDSKMEKNSSMRKEGKRRREEELKGNDDGGPKKKKAKISQLKEKKESKRSSDFREVCKNRQESHPKLTMDFSLLPDNVFLQILEYLPMEDCARVGRVNKAFRRMSQLAISRTKFLDLNDDRLLHLSDNQLVVILDLCSPNLEKIEFPFGDRRRVQFAPQLATTLANYECPRLIDITLWSTPIDSAVFEQLIRNNSNLERLSWHGRFVGFPDVTSNSLKSLYLTNVNDVTIQSITGRIPNLKELYFLYINVTANVLDEFFASTPQIQRVMLCLARVMNQIVLDESLVNFWNLSLTYLNITQYGPIDLHKVATSFPHLQTLLMIIYNPSNHGISALAALQELEILDILKPTNYSDDEVRALVACKQLRNLRLSQSISSGTFIALLGSCPLLEFIQISEIHDVDIEDEAAVVLGNLSGIAKRDFIIRFDPFDDEEEEWQQSIWESKDVEEAIKQLELNEGFKVYIDWF